MKFWRYIANKKNTLSNTNNDSLEESKKDITDSSSSDLSKEDGQKQEEQSKKEESSKGTTQNQENDRESQDDMDSSTLSNSEVSSVPIDLRKDSSEFDESDKEDEKEEESSKDLDSSESLSKKEQTPQQEQSPSEQGSKEESSNSENQDKDKQESSEDQEGSQEQSSSENGLDEEQRSSQEESPSQQSSSANQNSSQGQSSSETESMEEQDVSESQSPNGQEVGPEQSVSQEQDVSGEESSSKNSSQGQSDSQVQGSSTPESSKEQSASESPNSNEQESSKALDTSQEQEAKGKESGDKNTSKKQNSTEEDSKGQQDLQEIDASKDKPSLKEKGTKDTPSEIDDTSLQQELKEDKEGKKDKEFSKEKAHKRKKDPLKDGDAEVPKEKIEKPERTEATNQFLGQLGNLPFFKDRSHGGSYSIDTVSDTEVSETVIRTLITKFLNQRFCRKVSDLNVRSTALERSEGFYRWDVKKVVKHLETEQLTKVLHDKYGYQYAQGKYENVPLSFYFDMSGSMSNYTNMLAVMAIELLKKEVKVLVGFNETVHVQIESIPKELTVKELAKFLSSAGSSSTVQNCPKETKDRITYRAINQDIDKYLIAKKAEKCVIFADCDPIDEIIRLSQKAQVYWFNFESYFRSYDLGGYKGFAYKVSSLEDIAEGLIKVNEKRFEALVYTDTDEAKTLRR